jgi:Flp pilus assembly protein TadD
MSPDQRATAPPQALHSALEHFRAGRFSETERICRQVLQIDPNEADALYLLGLIAQQTRKTDAAIQLIGNAARLQPSNFFFANSLGELYSAANSPLQAENCFRRALTLSPDFAEAHNNLGNVLKYLRRPKEAEESYRRALALEPDYAGACANLGATLLESKHFNEAEQTFRKLLALKPDSADAHNGLGVALHELGRSAEAERGYRAALAIEPDFAEAHNNLGNALKDLGRLKEAEESYRRALALKPYYADAHGNLGLVLLDLAQFEEAEQSFRRLLGLKPDSADAHNGLGIALHELGRNREAEQSYRQALTLQPKLTEAHVNLGNVLQDLGQVNEAELSYRRALALDPDNAAAQYNLAIWLLELGKIEEAESRTRRALALKPGDPRASLNYAWLRLLQGDYESGFQYYESRFEGGGRRNGPRVPTLQAKLGGVPRWQGENLQNKRLLVWTEQGFGDSLMMMRYLQGLKNRGVGHLTVSCDPALDRIMQTIAAVDRVLSTPEPVQLSEFDCHCPIMSLPLLFQTRLESIPAEVPYLRVPAELRSKWARKLADKAAPKVGLVWAGGKLLQADARRSIALQRFSPLLDVTGPVFVSLQKGEEGDQLRKSGLRMLDWIDECQDFLDTAALIEQLDLVIGVDTAVVHLTGALGKPVWLLNRFDGEWRWLLDREDSPWYPTARIFRQTKPDEWDEVIARVALALRQQFNSL